MSDIIVPQSDVKLCTRNVNLYYGENHALKDINLDIKTNKITAFIGPSGCGKSTYLKSLNRMNDLVPVSYTHLRLQSTKTLYLCNAQGF